MTPDLLHDHPSHDQLRQFSNGLGPIDATTAVEQHVRDCAACWATLAELPPSDPFLDVLRDTCIETRHDLFSGAPRSVPLQVGDYRIVREVGRGGMGVVYEAEQVSLGRHVAVKLLPDKFLADARLRGRFEREARAAGRLHHTNIVPVFGVGEHAGQPFYVMQFIAGVGLDEVLAALRRLRQDAGSAPPSPNGGPSGSARQAEDMARCLLAGRFEPAGADADVTVVMHPQAMEVPSPPAPLPAGASSGGLSLWESLPYGRSVAQLGVQAAEALEYAHHQGVLHRDVKPSNLLLDARGTVWVTDFGLAKADDQQDLTHTGEVLGTLRYLPPEAFDGQTDARSDVFSLGLTLYELLAFRPAFDATSRAVLVRQVMTAEPPRLRTLNRATPRDLETIVHKAVDRDPAQRYASAGELAADLQRFLDDEPIRARRMSPSERVLRWARRNRVVAALSAAVLVASLAGTVVSTYFAFEARAGARREQIAAAAERTAAAAAVRARRQSDLQAARLELKEALRQAESGAVDVGLFGLIEALRLAPRDEDAEDFRRAVRLNFAAWSRQLPTLRYIVRLWGVNEPREKIWIHPVGPDGKTFAFWRRGRPVQLRETPTGRLLGEWDLPAKETPLALSLDGALLLARIGRSHESCFLQLRGLADGKPTGARAAVPLLHPRQAFPSFQSFVLSPRWVMTGGMTGGAPEWGPRRFWDLEKGNPYPLRLSDEGLPTYQLVLNSRGKATAFVFRRSGAKTRDGDWRAEAHDVETGQPAVLPLRLAGGLNPRVDVSGRTILSIHGDESAATPVGDGSVRWWDAATLRLLELWQPRRKAWFSSLTPDSQTLVAYGQDDRIRLYDLDTGLQRGGDLHLPGIQVLDELPGAAYPSEPVLLTNRGEGLLRAWDVSRLWPQATAAANPRATPPDKPLFRFQTAAAAPDGKQVLLAANGPLDYGRLIDVATGRLVGPPLSQPYLSHVAFSANGRLAAAAPHHFWVGGAPVQVHIRDRKTGRPHVAPCAMPSFIHALAFSPDGRTLAVGIIGGVVLLDADTGRFRHRLVEDSVAASLAFSPDGVRLAVGYRSGWPGKGAGVRLWNVESGKPAGDFHPLASGTGNLEVRFIDEGRLVLLHDKSAATLFLYDPETAQPLAVQAPAGRFHEMASRPGKAIVAVCYTGGTISQWDLRAGKPVGATMEHPGRVARMEYSPDGSVLAAAGKDNAVRLWDSATGLPLGPPLMHGDEVLAMGFTPDSREVITVSAAGEVRRWPLPEPGPDDPDLLALWVQAAAGRELGGRETALLDLDAWEERCRELQQRWPAAAPKERCAASEADWHEARARSAEATGNTRALLWRLERLARLRPGDGRLAVRRGAALASAGDYAAAEAAFAEAVRRGAGAELSERCAHEAAMARNLGREELARWYRDR